MSGVDQLLCYRLWRMGALPRPVAACGGMSLSTLESYVDYLTFIDFFFPLTLTKKKIPFHSLLLILIFLLTHLLIMCLLFFWFCFVLELVS